MTYVETRPTLATYIHRDKLVGEALGRAVTWQDLDKMAEHGVFITPMDHLIYDTFETFKL